MTDFATKAQEIVARHYREVEAIRADRRFSDAGKRQKIAASYLRARNGADALQKEAAAAREAERQRVEGRLFRQPTSAATSENIARQASYRDALERAARVAASAKDHEARSAELRSMLDLAELTGDDLQAQAIIAVAMQHRDEATLNAYASKRPEAEADLQQLVNLSAPWTSNSFREGFSYVVQRPEELAHVHDHQLPELVGSAVDQPLSADGQQQVDHQQRVQEFTQLADQRGY